MSAVPARATTSTTIPCFAASSRTRGKSPPSVFRTQIELPAHHRQHAHDGQPLRRRPLQKLRRRRFLAIGNVVDKAKCGDAAPLEGFAVGTDESGALDREAWLRKLAGSARGASDGAGQRRERGEREARGRPERLTDEAAHVQRNDAIELTIAQPPLPAAADVHGGHLVSTAHDSSLRRC